MKSTIDVIIGPYHLHEMVSMDSTHTHTNLSHVHFIQWKSWTKNKWRTFSQTNFPPLSALTCPFTKSITLSGHKRWQKCTSEQKVSSLLLYGEYNNCHLYYFCVRGTTVRPKSAPTSHSHRMQWKHTSTSTAFGWRVYGNRSTCACFQTKRRSEVNRRRCRRNCKFN